MAAAGALPLREHKRGLRKRVELRPVEPHCRVLFQCGHECIGNTVQHENLLLANAEQVVVVGGALHHTSRGAVDVGGGVHEHRRVARPGADGALAGLHRRVHHARPTGHAEQAHVFVRAHLAKRLECRLLDDGGDVLDADGTMDRLVKFAHRHRSAAAGRRVGVEHDRVAGGNNVDDVAGQGRDRVGRGRHRTDDAERCVFLERNAVVAAKPIGAQPLDPRHVADDLELFDLVIESADLRFLKLDSAPLLVVLLAQALDDLNDPMARLDALPSQLLERLSSGIARLISGFEHAKIPTANAFGLATARVVIADWLGCGGRRDDLRAAA